MPERKAILLRLDPALHDALQRWAGAELRSLNAQIEYLLRQAARAAGRLKDSGNRSAGAAGGGGAGRST
ncbi:MAG: hypothetical protein ACT4PM_00885 [Gemmatimonadales bacterium]